MKCPICQKEMQTYWEGITNNGEKEDKHKEYKRKIYHCEDDDAWVSVETPIIPLQHIG